MKRFTYRRASYDVSERAGIPLILPAGKKYENLEQAFAPLIAGGFDAYVRKARMTVVVLQRPPTVFFGWYLWLRSPWKEGVYLVDADTINEYPGEYIASILVHEATHAYQDRILPKHARNDNDLCEEMAISVQKGFLRQIGSTEWVRKLEKAAQPRYLSQRCPRTDKELEFYTEFRHALHLKNIVP